MSVLTTLQKNKRDHVYFYDTLTIISQKFRVKVLYNIGKEF